jgi:hypothetical protein
MRRNAPRDDGLQRLPCNTLRYTSTNYTHSVHGTIILQSTAFTKPHALYCTNHSDTKKPSALTHPYILNVASNFFFLFSGVARHC